MSLCLLLSLPYGLFEDLVLASVMDISLGWGPKFKPHASRLVQAGAGSFRRLQSRDGAIPHSRRHHSRFWGIFPLLVRSSFSCPVLTGPSEAPLIGGPESICLPQFRSHAAVPVSMSSRDTTVGPGGLHLVLPLDSRPWACPLDKALSHLVSSGHQHRNIPFIVR